MMWPLPSRGLTSFNPRLRAGGDNPVSVESDADYFVSIHASAREATSTMISIRNIMYGFNPRLRAGGDGRNESLCRHLNCFNPRLRAGGDG